MKQFGFLIPYHNGEVRAVCICTWNSHYNSLHCFVSPGSTLSPSPLTNTTSLQKFFGKVVRVDLQAMGNLSECASHYRIERYDAQGRLVVNTTVSDPDDACVFVIDLASKHPKAVGFRRGFVGFPHGYLAAGHYSVVAQLDLENFGLDSTRLIDLSLLDSTYGGYSGGFADGSWACFK